MEWIFIWYVIFRIYLEYIYRIYIERISYAYKYIIYIHGAHEQALYYIVITLIYRIFINNILHILYHV